MEKMHKHKNFFIGDLKITEACYLVHFSKTNYYN